MELRAGKWVHFEITADLSQTDGGRWSLTVTEAGGAPRSFHDLPVVNPECRKLNWIGFISNATQRTEFYLDNFVLHP